MNISGKLIALVSLAAITTMAQGAMADTTKATCDVHRHHDEKHEKSGSCTFSQRQGYVDIELRNGDTYNLRPASKANHFKDQDGHSVVRHKENGNSQRYQWDHMNILVKFHSGNSGQSHHSSGKFGETPHKLHDLVGQSGGEAEDKLQSRGYVVRNSSKSGNSVYSHWKERSSGRCVAIHSVHGVYKSVVYSPEYDCKQ